MMLCLTCGIQKPNKYTRPTCPHCKSILKYVDGPAKSLVFKMYMAGLSVSYATAEVYSYGYGAIHTVNICIGVANPYKSVVFRELPSGIGYVSPYTHEFTQSPTYGLLRYETPYIDRNEARKVLKHKLKELDAWVDEAVNCGWLSICHLGGLL